MGLPATRSPSCGSRTARAASGRCGRTRSALRCSPSDSAARCTNSHSRFGNDRRSSFRPPPGCGARCRLGLPTGVEKGRWLVEFIVATWEELNHPCSERAVDHALGRAARRIDAHRDERAVLVHGDVHQWKCTSGPGGWRRVPASRPRQFGSGGPLNGRRRGCCAPRSTSSPAAARCSLSPTASPTSTSFGAGSAVQMTPSSSVSLAAATSLALVRTRATTAIRAATRMTSPTTNATV